VHESEMLGVPYINSLAVTELPANSLGKRF
jgi:hypothetical protein